MFQIDTPSATSIMPTPTTAGTPGWFQHGNAATGTPYTVVSSDFLNIIQAELLNLLTYAGITASKTTQTQVAQALSLLHGIQAWAVSGSFTVPAYVYKIKVIATGGGGGGAGGASTQNGGGGGAGGTAIGYYTVTPGSVLTITVGAAGAGGAAGFNAGGNGGNTACGSLCSAGGGSGGANSSGVTTAGGPGGVGASGQVNVTGGNGFAGGVPSVFTGNGAASYWGGGGEATTAVNALGNGQAFGSGGGGGVYTSINLAGNPGCAGVVVIEW